MPVILENISNPSPDDLDDLIKLFQDYPATLANAHIDTQVDTQVDTPVDTPVNGPLSDWINDKLASGQQLFAGRFNGRLIAAVWGIPAFYSWQLEHLCVRAITRRRGIARQLLTLLAQHADIEKLDLKVVNSIVPPELKPLLTDLGFSCDASACQAQELIWTKAARPTEPTKP